MHTQNLTSAQSHSYICIKPDIRSKSLSCTHKVWRPLKVTPLHAQSVSLTELSARITCSIFSYPLTRIHSLINPFNLSLTLKPHLCTVQQRLLTFASECIPHRCLIQPFIRKRRGVSCYQKQWHNQSVCVPLDVRKSVCGRQGKNCVFVCGGWRSEKVIKLRKWRTLLSWFSFSYFGKQT
jgi:hypothetical protein